MDHLPVQPGRTRHDLNRSPVECIISGECKKPTAAVSGVILREFVSAACGATSMATGKAVFRPGARLPYHKHNFTEAATILVGEAAVAVEGRKYLLRPFDCIHLPAGVAHEVENASPDAVLVAHWAFATSLPGRELVADRPLLENRLLGNPLPDDPEHIVRFAEAQKYELAHGTRFCDLFAGRFGAVGICGGYGEFNPGCSLPCHIHEYDESVSIMLGEAVCEVMGKRYRLSNYDTAFVPRGRPHRFLNDSSNGMAMLWVYAGCEPERTILDVRYCEGSLSWEEQVGHEKHSNSRT